MPPSIKITLELEAGPAELARMWDRLAAHLEWLELVVTTFRLDAETERGGEL
jgi:hypothetical protein